jgi:hypothetical protein
MEDLDTLADEPKKKADQERELVSWVMNRFKNKVKISRMSKAYERFIPR